VTETAGARRLAAALAAAAGAALGSVAGAVGSCELAAARNDLDGGCAPQGAWGGALAGAVLVLALRSLAREAARRPGGRRLRVAAALLVAETAYAWARVATSFLRASGLDQLVFFWMGVGLLPVTAGVAALAAGLARGRGWAVRGAATVAGLAAPLALTVLVAHAAGGGGGLAEPGLFLAANAGVLWATLGAGRARSGHAGDDHPLDLG
jgi:hypothetical protein